MVHGYNDWLAVGDRLAETEEDWSKMDRTELIAAIMEHKPESVFEICCGTGWIPYNLPLQVHYLGADANVGCIGLAMKKNPSRDFIQGDLLNPNKWPRGIYDMVLGFSCLKHFTLADWDTIYGKMLFRGKKTLATVYLASEDREDPGFEFPHTAVSMEHLERVICQNGHRLVQIFTLPPLNKGKEPLVLTERLPDSSGIPSSDGGATLEWPVETSNTEMPTGKSSEEKTEPTSGESSPTPENSSSEDTPPDPFENL